MGPENYELNSGTIIIDGHEVPCIDVTMESDKTTEEPIIKYPSTSGELNFDLALGGSMYAIFGPIGLSTWIRVKCPNRRVASHKIWQEQKNTKEKL